eukprot:5790133-Pyramimonas_sp.AAC.1
MADAAGGAPGAGTVGSGPRGGDPDGVEGATEMEWAAGGGREALAEGAREDAPTMPAAPEPEPEPELPNVAPPEPEPELPKVPGRETAGGRTGG